MRTRVTEEYGIDIPLVSAGMAFVATPALVAAVSNAGGLGTFGAGLMPPEALPFVVQEIRALTVKPFAFNFITPFAQEGHIDACIAQRVPVVSFHWEDPPEAWIGRLHGAGIKIWQQVGTVEAAQTAVEKGVDAIIAQGLEAGGHNRGSAGMIALVPAIAEAVAVPVLAAGGIADGRGFAAALALGAEGVWVGTRFVASPEAYAHAEYKSRIVAAGVDGTAMQTIFGPEWPGAPARALRNRVVREWAGREDEIPPGTGGTIGQTLVGGQPYVMPKFSAILPTPDTSGDFEEMCMVAGESAGLVHEMKGAGEIVREMADEAERLIRHRLVPMTRSAGGE